MGRAKRMRPPVSGLKTFQKIDVVLLSHNHYDHLDLATIKLVFEKHHPKIITALGVKAFLDEKKMPGAIDLDWWQKLSLTDSVEIRLSPHSTSPAAVCSTVTLHFGVDSSSSGQEGTSISWAIPVTTNLYLKRSENAARLLKLR
ncbi:MAG: MBL fold metallo-hydrolase [Bacteroidota bacterium]